MNSMLDETEADAQDSAENRYMPIDMVGTARGSFPFMGKHLGFVIINYKLPRSQTIIPQPIYVLSDKELPVDESVAILGTVESQIVSMPFVTRNAETKELEVVKADDEVVAEDNFLLSYVDGTMAKFGCVVDPAQNHGRLVGPILITSQLSTKLTRNNVPQYLFEGEVGNHVAVHGMIKLRKPGDANWRIGRYRQGNLNRISGHLESKHGGEIIAKDNNGDPILHGGVEIKIHQMYHSVIAESEIMSKNTQQGQWYPNTQANASQAAGPEVAQAPGQNAATPAPTPAPGAGMGAFQQHQSSTV